MGRKYKNNTAFSLVELLVVITIIAVLAAIAVPFYKSYTLRSKVFSTIEPIQTLAEASILYAQKNDRFPNARQLGLNIAFGNAVVSDPSTYNQYIDGLEIGGDLCGGKSTITYFINNAILGGGLSSLQINYNIIQYNSAYETLYSYRMSDVAGNEVTGEIFPGWYNNADDMGAAEGAFIDRGFCGK